MDPRIYYASAVMRTFILPVKNPAPVESGGCEIKHFGFHCFMSEVVSVKSVHFHGVDYTGVFQWSRGNNRLIFKPTVPAVGRRASVFDICMMGIVCTRQRMLFLWGYNYLVIS